MSESEGGQGYECEECGRGYQSYGHHLRWNPECCVPALVDVESDSDEEEYTWTPRDEQKGPKIAQRFASDVLRHEIAHDLSKLRYRRGLDNPTIVELKTAVNRWAGLCWNEVLSGLEPHLKEGTSTEEISSLFPPDLFAGLGTDKLERSFATEKMPYIEPRVVQLDKGEDPNDTVASFDIGSLVERHLQHKPSLMS